MSIEQFHEAYPANERFSQEISIRPEHGTMSPVRFMAGIYTREGSNGLSQTSYKLAHRASSGTAKADKEDHAALIRNASAVYFGHTLIAIEDIILDGNFDQETFNRNLEFSFTGSILDPKPIPNPFAEKIDERDIAIITRNAMNDKTFSSFFKNKYYLLPHSMKIFLSNTGVYQYIDNLMLPEYTERVKRLIEASAQQKATIG